jgi:hypothetical protein
VSSAAPGGPDYSQQLYDETVVEATDVARREGAASAIGLVTFKALGIEDQSDQLDFTHSAYIAVAGYRARDSYARDEDVHVFLDELPRNWLWAEEVAELGKGLSDETTFRPRARALLGYAATMFESAYEASVDKLPPSAILDLLANNYFRVAALQDEVGDKAGARETALVVAPHLLELAEPINELNDGIAILTHESALSDAMIYIGTLETDLTRQLFGATRDPKTRTKVVNMLTRRSAGELLAAGNVADGLRQLETRRLEPLNETWLAASSLLKSGQFETANEIIDGIAARFPDYFTDASVAKLIMMPTIDVLMSAGRDDMLHQVFASLIEKGKDVAPIIEFATRCGLQKNAARLNRVVAGLDLSANDLAAQYFAAYERGLDRSFRS